MGMRNWAVGVVSVAAVVAGVVVVQSGISGSALPILPHRSAAAAAEDGPDLPAPAEVSAPPPAAGAVRQVPATGAAVAVRHGPAVARPRAQDPAARPAPSAKEPKERKGEDSGKDSGKDDGRSGSGKGEKPAKD
jgi:hypothetical protein